MKQGIFASRTLLPVVRSRVALVLQEGPLGDRRVAVDGIDGDDGGQDGRLAGAAVDQIADGDQDAARCGHRSGAVTRVQSRFSRAVSAAALSAASCAHGLRGPGLVRVVILLGDSVLFEQVVVAASCVLVRVHLRGVFGHGGLLVLQVGFELPIVDDEERVAFFDERAFLKGRLLDEAAHARLHCGRLRAIANGRCIRPNR